MQKFLVIDDDKMMCERFTVLIERLGGEAVCAHTLEQGLAKAASEDFDIVLLDVHLPDGCGIDAVSEIKRSPSEPEIIIVTAYGDPDAAETAIRSGAWGYLEKAPSEKEMIQPLEQITHYRQEKLSRSLPLELEREGIVGESPKLKHCLDLVARASISEASVLITGETGVGKELFARAIHDNSSRASKNFVVVDCTALPQSLIESVLFGHEKGAFTGADRARGGLIEQAHEGTLFLDEVAELPLEIQKSFLRVLQERKFRRIGGKTEKDSSFKLVAATHRNLEEMASEGLFREDLLFRLRSIALEIPPLRERVEDIKALTLYHVNRLCHHYRMDRKTISTDFFDALATYHWPGNVRELINALDAAICEAGHEPQLFVNDLPTHIRVQMARASVSREKDGNGQTPEIAIASDSFPLYKDFRHALEKRYFQELVKMCPKDVKKACAVSGMSRSRLYEILAKHQITFSEPPSTPPAADKPSNS